MLLVINIINQPLVIPLVIKMINYTFGNILRFIIDIGGVGGGMSVPDSGVSGSSTNGVEIGDSPRL